MFWVCFTVLADQRNLLTDVDFRDLPFRTLSGVYFTNIFSVKCDQNIVYASEPVWLLLMDWHLFQIGHQQLSPWHRPFGVYKVCPDIMKNAISTIKHSAGEIKHSISKVKYTIVWIPLSLDKIKYLDGKNQTFMWHNLLVLAQYRLAILM